MQAPATILQLNQSQPSDHLAFQTIKAKYRLNLTNRVSLFLITILIHADDMIKMCSIEVEALCFGWCLNAFTFVYTYTQANDCCK